MGAGNRLACELRLHTLALIAFLGCMKNNPPTYFNLPAIRESSMI